MSTFSFSQIDHLIFAAPTLETGNRIIEEKLGIRPHPGGRHPGLGTHNSLLKIGPGTYLEVIAPDPKQQAEQPLWMGLDDIKEPGLIWWAAKAHDLPDTVKKARQAGWDLGEVRGGSRLVADGSTLSWQLTDPFLKQEAGILPFLIDWGDGTHPTDTLVDDTCRLVDLQLLHPDPERIRSYLAMVGLEIPVHYDHTPAIRAGLTTAERVVYL
jgi:hypothetical protein